MRLVSRPVECPQNQLVVQLDRWQRQVHQFDVERPTSQLSFDKVIEVILTSRTAERIPQRDDSKTVNAYHRFLVWEMMNKPPLIGQTERLLNPLFGKSLIVYYRKPALL